MKTVSIGQMIRSLVAMIPTGELSSVNASFVQIAAKQSQQGADTSSLSDKQVEQIDSIFREYFA